MAKQNGKTTINLSRWGDTINSWSKELYDEEKRRKDRVWVMKGGASSGKSFEILSAVLFFCITEKRRVMIARQTMASLKESVFSNIKQILDEKGLSDLFEVNKTDMTFTCKHNGSYIFMRGLEDSERIKSVVCDMAVIEEASEISEESFHQINLRVRQNTPHPKNIYLMLNPVSASNWIKKYFFDNEKVRRDTKIIETTYKDNRFLSPEMGANLEKLKFQDPHYYSIYVLNQWGSTGESYFDSNIINNRINELKEIRMSEQSPEIIRGKFVYDYKNEKIIDSSIKFSQDSFGPIVIYRKPKLYNPYVIGGDTAGDTYGDSFCCSVVDNMTSEQVAVLHQNTDETDFARQCYCLGKYYNYALIGLETNYSTYPVKELQRLGYMNQFQRRQEDRTYVDLKESYGFLTNKLTRPLILANLAELINESQGRIFNDIPTLEEMLVFIRNPKKNGRPEADTNCHDDRVLATAIGYYDGLRDQQRRTPKRPKEKSYNKRKKSIYGY